MYTVSLVALEAWQLSQQLAFWLYSLLSHEVYHFCKTDYTSKKKAAPAVGGSGVFSDCMRTVHDPTLVQRKSHLDEMICCHHRDAALS